MESQKFLILVGYKKFINPRAFRRFAMYDLHHWMCPVTIPPGIYKARMVDTDGSWLSENPYLEVVAEIDGELSWLGISLREFGAWSRGKFVKLVCWKHDVSMDYGVRDER